MEREILGSGMAARSVNRSLLAAQIVGMVLVFGAVLFLPAGTLRWPGAWAFLFLMFGFTIAGSVWLLRFNPDLLAERMTGVGRRDQAGWDKTLLIVVAIAFFAWFVGMALDAVRFHWSREPPWLQVAGGFLLTISFVVFYWTARANPYLSPAVRIQSDRGHTVVSTGPYRFVRHPMYAGFALYVFGTALLLGSYWGLAGGVVLIVLVARRAVLEEGELLRGLEGYDAYMRRVRYRLIPGVW